MPETDKLACVFHNVKMHWATINAQGVAVSTTTNCHKNPTPLVGWAEKTQVLHFSFNYYYRPLSQHTVNMSENM